MLKIGYFSKLPRISIRMLRHYDEIGLLMPASTDDFTSYRFYSEAQLPVANRITALKEMGFSLSAIVEILKHYDNPKALLNFLSVKQTELQEQAEDAARRLRLLETALERLRKDNSTMNYDVTLKTMPERTVACVRKTIPSYDQEGILWGILMQETAQMNLQLAEPCYGLAVFHDEGYKDSDVDVEIQECVQGTYQNTENVVFKTEPEIQFASAIYRGNYEQLTFVHQEVAEWVNDNGDGYEFSGAMFCIYHVSPAQTQNPDELVTEVCYPVKKK